MRSDQSSAGWSLRKRLLLSFGLAILLLFSLTQALIVFGVPYTSFKGLWASQTQKTIVDISAMASARKAQLEQWIFERRGNAMAIAENPWLRMELLALLHQPPSVGKAKAGETLKRIRLYLQRVEDSYYGEYSLIEIIEANSGKVLVSTRPEEEGRNTSRTTYFSKAMNPSVEEVVVNELDEGGKASDLVLARAIHEPAGDSTAATLAVLVLHNPMDRITSTLLHEGIGRTGEIVLVDQNSLLMTPLRYPLADGSVAQPLVFVNPAKPAALAARGIETVIEAPDYRGVVVLAATRHLRVTSELAWGLVVKIDKAEVFQPVRGTLVAHALVLAGALLAGGLMILLIATRLAKPLTDLSRAAVSIADGDLSVRTMPRGSRELQDLSRSFNIMIARLEHWHQDLAAEVEKRTAELSDSNEALRENRATLRQILDTAPQSIFWKDLQGVYLGCNRVFANAAGLDDPERIKGKTDFDLPWPKEEAEAYRADDREVTQGNQIKRHIIEPLQQADGNRLWIDTTKVPLLDGGGKVIGVLGVYEDITERKRTAEKQEELETRLRQSQKMEAIGTLAGGIAHDFNNILAAIFGYTELAIDEEDNIKLGQHLEQVRLGAERAKELVKQILAFSRKTDEERHPLQVALVVKEAMKMLRSSIPTTIAIKQDLASKGTVLADPTQIHQIIMNLCANAYHAMRETGGTLAISLNEIEIRNEDEGYGELVPGRYLKLEVSDTGCGITPEILEKIFEPYFTTKKTGEGTGLGLAVVHGIVKSHHGHITVYSEPGRGTTFHVYLPLIEEKAADLPGKEAIKDLAGHGEHILFVDDELQIRELADKLFSLHGYRVTLFTNGVQALEEFQDHPGQFDLIITDMTMPYMTGAELAQKILGIRPDIPIILCTGQSELINREKALAMGIYDYLTKPVVKHDFLSAIRKALQHKVNKAQP